MATFNFNFDGENSKLTYNDQDVKFDDMSIYSFKHKDGTMHTCVNYSVMNDDGSVTNKTLTDCKHCEYNCYCGHIERPAQANLAKAAKIIAKKFDYKK
jgi:hypothetical protein